MMGVLVFFEKNSRSSKKASASFVDATMAITGALSFLYILHAR